MAPEIRLQTYGYIGGRIHPDKEYSMPRVPGETRTIGESDEADIQLLDAGVATGIQGSLTVLPDLSVLYEEPVRNPEAILIHNNFRRHRLEVVGNVRSGLFEGDVRIYADGKENGIGVGVRAILD
jgi:hypothetical protein